jgi:D-alanyl-D-alanine carboxypeptidase
MEQERRECASLTKVMTIYVVLKLMERFSIEDTTLITIGGDAASVIGTSAELHEGDTLTI